MRKLIAGNWKMNGLQSAVHEVEAVVEGLHAKHENADILICPPATLLHSLARIAGESRLFLGGQTCHCEVSGAHTGDISAEMLADAGARFVIVGHSERRADHNESDSDVAAQAEAALKSGLTPIICCGETLAQREAGETNDVILAQLGTSIPATAAEQKFVVAYEPIWAIGTGLTASPEQIAGVHGAIRSALCERFGEQGSGVKILYGGSMKPANAAEILAVQNVNGGLIGGASLKANDFLSIYDAAE